MPSLRPCRLRLARRLPCGLLFSSILLLSACKSAQKPDTSQADQMAMWLDSVPQLKTLNVSNVEVAELSKAHEAGLTDPSGVALIRLARVRSEERRVGKECRSRWSAYH